MDASSHGWRTGVERKGRTPAFLPSTLAETKATYRIVGTMSGSYFGPNFEGVGSREKRGSQETVWRPGLQVGGKGLGSKGSVYLLRVCMEDKSV